MPHFPLESLKEAVARDAFNLGAKRCRDVLTGYGLRPFEIREVAREILGSLSETDFDETVIYEDNATPHDVYKPLGVRTQNPKLKTVTGWYVKFYLEESHLEGESAIVVSLHPPEYDKVSQSRSQARREKKS